MLIAFSDDQLKYNISSGMGNVKCESLFKHGQSNVIINCY